MNYATDRLDRKALGRTTTTANDTKDDNDANDKRDDSAWDHHNYKPSDNTEEEHLYQKHVTRGQELRDQGKNAHALYHYGQAVIAVLEWIDKDRHNHPRTNNNNNNNNDHKGQGTVAWVFGDYAQMAELAGFVEIGLIAMLMYYYIYHKERLLVQSYCQHSSSSSLTDLFAETQSSSSSATTHRPCDHCGCYDPRCGQSPCFIPFSLHVIHQVLRLFQTDSKTILLPRTLPLVQHNDMVENETMTSLKANDILNRIANRCNPKVPSIPPLKGNPSDSMAPSLVELLSHHRDSQNSGHSQSSSIILQMLFLKLLYLTMPQLASLLVVEWERQMALLSQQNQKHRIDHHTHHDPYKSHKAYHVLLRSVILGQRRKHPSFQCIWDLLVYHQDTQPELDITTQDEERTCGVIADFVQDLEQVSTTCQSPTTLSPLQWLILEPSGNCHYKDLHIVGDSHVLSYAWQTLTLQDQTYRIVPHVVTGLKAFHVQSGRQFFTNQCLATTFDRILSTSSSPFNSHDNNGATILISAGEIDCREGMGGPALAGYNDLCRTAIERTVQSYVRGLEELVQLYKTSQPQREYRRSLDQILVLPVLPHAERSTGRPLSQTSRRQTIQYWNNCLRGELDLLTKTKHVFFLDYVDAMACEPSSGSTNNDDQGYVLRPEYVADTTHVNAGAVAFLQQAILECGCNLKLL